MSDDLARDPGTEPVDAVDAADTEAAVGVPAAGAAGAGDAELAPDASGLADASLLALLGRLAGILERSDLLELEVESGETGIVLRKVAALAAPATGAAGSGEPASAARPPEPGSPAADASLESSPPARAAVLAPLTGIFYASPSPGSAPFVAVGREVVVGQVIGLIEAMKLFNEIKSDKAGRVVRVVAENGALVKAKHALLEVEPL
jgi:acetyl-CoA carboxylase biotin carboxyl carrier protein